MKWQTEITHVDFQKSFIDFQKKGPYKLWKHHHEFIPNDEGVLMRDTIDYETANGLPGRNCPFFIREKETGLYL
jgi:ligand-binding SRPBCC domain-containing protein